MFLKVVSLILIIVPAFYFGYQGKTVEMGLSILAGGIAAAFLNIDKFKSFKGAGFEAELKEVVNEAYATIDSLKKVANTLCEFALNQLVYGDRFGGAGIPKKIEHKEKIVSLAKEMSVYEDSHMKLIEVFNRFQSWDLFGFINNYLLIHEGENGRELRDELDKRRDGRTTNYPSKSELEEIFKKYNIQIEGTLKTVIENYLYYLEHQELPEEYA